MVWERSRGGYSPLGRAGNWFLNFIRGYPFFGRDSREGGLSGVERSGD